MNRQITSLSLQQIITKAVGWVILEFHIWKFVFHYEQLKYQCQKKYLNKKDVIVVPNLGFALAQQQVFNLSKQEQFQSKGQHLKVILFDKFELRDLHLFYGMYAKCSCTLETKWHYS